MWLNGRPKHPVNHFVLLIVSELRKPLSRFSNIDITEISVNYTHQVPNRLPLAA